MNPHRPLPPRYPIDERTPSDVADPYSLSKQVDEHTLRAVCRRFGASGVALRLPLMISAGERAPACAHWAARERARRRRRRLGLARRARRGRGVPAGADRRLRRAPTSSTWRRRTRSRTRRPTDLLRRHAPDVPRGGTTPAARRRSTPAARGELLGFAAPVRRTVDDADHDGGDVRARRAAGARPDRHRRGRRRLGRRLARAPAGHDRRGRSASCPATWSARTRCRSPRTGSG